MKNYKGFTLIELLIVVAIIAILAAIAIPNFLAAQTRSKVAAVLADMQTMATALESYRVDNDSYPHDADDVPPGPSFNCNSCLIPCTTPIAYITSIPHDPFNLNGDNGSPQFAYQYLSMAPWQSGITVYDVSEGGWGIGSCGPNLVWDYEFYIPNHDAYYDPTNGIVSNGDLIRTDKGAMSDLAIGPGTMGTRP